MRALGLAMVMVAAGGAVCGSAAAQEPATTVLPGMVMTLAGTGCPVGFSAQVNTRAVMHSAAEEKKYGDAQTLELRFMPRVGTRVVSASVTVHGLAMGSRVLPVTGAAEGMASQGFELTAAAGLGEREVRVTKLAVVRWAEVTEMTYADGTRWRPGQGESCRARPPLYREVGVVAGK